MGFDCKLPNNRPKISLQYDLEMLISNRRGLPFVPASVTIRTMISINRFSWLVYCFSIAFLKSSNAKYH